MSDMQPARRDCLWDELHLPWGKVCREEWNPSAHEAVSVMVFSDARHGAQGLFLARLVFVPSHSWLPTLTASSLPHLVNASLDKCPTTNMRHPCWTLSRIPVRLQPAHSVPSHWPWSDDFLWFNQGPGFLPPPFRTRRRVAPGVDRKHFGRCHHLLTDETTRHLHARKGVGLGPGQGHP